MSDVLTVSDVAQLLGVHENTVLRQLHSIPHFRVGRLIRFHRGALDAWMQNVSHVGGGEEAAASVGQSRSVPAQFRQAVDRQRGGARPKRRAPKTDGLGEGPGDGEEAAQGTFLVISPADRRNRRRVPRKVA